MSKIKTIVLSYRYPGYPWKEYDRTRDKLWANTQYERMKYDHPGAEYKKDDDVSKTRIYK